MAITLRQYAEKVYEMRTKQNQVRAIPNDKKNAGRKQYYRLQVGTVCREVDALTQRILAEQKTLFGGPPGGEIDREEELEFHDEIPF